MTVANACELFPILWLRLTKSAFSTCWTLVSMWDIASCWYLVWRQTQLPLLNVIFCQSSTTSACTLKLWNGIYLKDNHCLLKVCPPCSLIIRFHWLLWLIQSRLEVQWIVTKCMASYTNVYSTFSAYHCHAMYIISVSVVTIHVYFQNLTIVVLVKESRCWLVEASQGQPLWMDILRSLIG